MTARLNFSESRKWSIRVTVALMLLFVGLLMATGCLNQSTAINQTYLPTTTVITIPEVTTISVPIIPTTCPVSANQLYWININSISNGTPANTVVITGSTNIPTGGVLDFRIFHPSRSKTAIPEIKGNVNIVKNGDCFNTFALIFNSTGLNGTRMAVNVYSSDNTLPGDNFPGNYSEFDIGSSQILTGLF